MSTLLEPKAPAVSHQHEVTLLREMLRIRRFEEKCVELYSLGKIHGFLHLYIGEEAVAVGVMQALTPEDRIVSTYREHGHALARGVPMDQLMAEMFGKANGCSRGRGGSMHLFDVSRRFYGGYAIVGGGLPIAVGLALADKMQNLPHITACFFGDGAVAEGEFHESMNLAALWKLPVLFICENNLYAMGTALERHQAQTDIALKAAGYGVPAAAVNNVAEMVADPQVQAREMFIEHDDPSYGKLRITGTPLKLSETPGRIATLAPLPGQHNEDVFVGMLGHSKDEVAKWETDGVI